MLKEAEAEHLREVRAAGLFLTYRLEKESFGGYTLTVTQSGKGETFTRVVRDFTRQRCRAEDFFRRVSDGGVTLLHLDDVVEDFLAE